MKLKTRSISYALVLASVISIMSEQGFGRGSWGNGESGVIAGNGSTNNSSNGSNWGGNSNGNIAVEGNELIWQYIGNGEVGVLYPGDKKGLFGSTISSDKSNLKGSTKTTIFLDGYVKYFGC